MGITALLAALIALPFAPSSHSPEVSSVLAVSAVALLIVLFVSDFGLLSDWKLNVSPSGRPLIFNVVTSLLVTVIFIYFMNGVYKLLGPEWIAGNSLHYVLGEPTLTRFSQSAWPMPSVEY